MIQLRRHFLKLFAGIASLIFFGRYFGTRLESEDSSEDFPSTSPSQNKSALLSKFRSKNEPVSWARLSSKNPDDIKSKYKAVVIGSGYGAAVAAARVSEKLGEELCILERGKEYQPGEFPKNLSQILKTLRIDGILPPALNQSSRLGLFNLTTTGGIDILSGNGLGGGSNINANVILEPLPHVFTGEAPNLSRDNQQRPWPIRIDDLRPYFKRVRTMLKAERFRSGIWVNDEQGGHWEMDHADKSKWRENLTRFGFSNASIDKFMPEQKRARLMKDFTQNVEKLNTLTLSDTNSNLDFEHSQPPLAVNLTQFDTGINGEKNHVGVPQRLCNQCGDCITGCNVGAKNTLIMNYLPQSKNNKSQIFTQMDVQYIEKRPAGSSSRYRVHYVFFTKRLALFPYNKHGYIDTDIVIVGAGSIGSTQILMRSQKLGGLNFSKKLGHYFSGNSDELSAVISEKIDATNVGFGSQKHPFLETNETLATEEIAGPCITSKVDFRNEFGMMFQDASVPSSLVGPNGLREKINNYLIFLGMGYDSSLGKMHLTKDEKIRISFPKLADEPSHVKAKGVVRAIANEIKGRYFENPRTKLRHPILNKGDGIPVTVHALGGCSMGTNIDSGVVDSAGRVFDANSDDKNQTHPGLYVTCGAALPTAVGANPLLTISAFADRVGSYMIGEPAPGDPKAEEAKGFQIL